MTLADALAAEEAAHSKGPACTVALIFPQLSVDDAIVLRKWLADPRKKHSWIAKALTKSDHRINQSTVGRHRNGECSCPE